MHVSEAPLRKAEWPTPTRVTSTPTLGPSERARPSDHTYGVVGSPVPPMTRIGGAPRAGEATTGARAGGQEEQPAMSYDTPKAPVPGLLASMVRARFASDVADTRSGLSLQVSAQYGSTS